MKPHGKQLTLVVLVICSLLAINGCSSNRVIYQKKDLDFQNIDEIAIAPVMDGRRSINAKVNFETESRGVNKKIVKTLKHKKYDAIFMVGNDAISNMHASQVPFLSSEQIREMQTSNIRWIMIPILDSYFKKTPTYSKDFCEMTFYQYDVIQGELVWEASSLGKNMKGAVSIALNKYPKKRK